MVLYTYQCRVMIIFFVHAAMWSSSHASERSVRFEVIDYYCISIKISRRDASTKHTYVVSQKTKPFGSCNDLLTCLCENTKYRSSRDGVITLFFRDVRRFKITSQIIISDVVYPVIQLQDTITAMRSTERLMRIWQTDVVGRFSRLESKKTETYSRNMYDFEQRLKNHMK